MTTSNIYRETRRNVPVLIPQSTLALPPPLIVTLLLALPTPETLLSFLLATRQAYDLYTTYRTQIQHSLVLHLIATLSDPDASLRIAKRLKKQFGYTWPKIYRLFYERRNWVLESWLGWEIYLDCLVPRPDRSNIIRGTDSAVLETLAKEELAGASTRAEFIPDLTPIFRLPLRALHRLSFPPPPPAPRNALLPLVHNGNRNARQTSPLPEIPTTTNTSVLPAPSPQPPLPTIAARIFYLRMGYIIATRARTWQEADFILNKCRNGCIEVLDRVGALESEVPEDELRDGGLVRAVMKNEGNQPFGSGNSQLYWSDAHTVLPQSQIASSTATAVGLAGQPEKEEPRLEGRVVWCDESWATEMVGVEGLQLPLAGQR